MATQFPQRDHGHHHPADRAHRSLCGRRAPDAHPRDEQHHGDCAGGLRHLCAVSLQRTAQPPADRAAQATRRGPRGDCADAGARILGTGGRRCGHRPARGDSRHPTLSGQLHRARARGRLDATGRAVAGGVGGAAGNQPTRPGRHAHGAGTRPEGVRHEEFSGWLATAVAATAAYRRRAARPRGGLCARTGIRHQAPAELHPAAAVDGVHAVRSARGSAQQRLAAAGQCLVAQQGDRAPAGRRARDRHHGGRSGV
ncbi:conserved hypothetical protein [Ricinus communis]|uniref:Uncharacterized protein n=1 Tax=Ricinus communis TaxID=3988 RepID=B9TMI2_RICCO|nr:conserved hypothetical protein [Ricinus communis]